MEWAWLTAPGSATMPTMDIALSGSNTLAPGGSNNAPAKNAGKRSGRGSSKSSSSSSRASGSKASASAKASAPGGSNSTPTKVVSKRSGRGSSKSSGSSTRSIKTPKAVASASNARNQDTPPSHSVSLPTSANQPSPSHASTVVASNSSQSVASDSLVNTMVNLPVCATGVTSVPNLPLFSPDSPGVTQFKLADNSTAVSGSVLSGTASNQTFSLGPPFFVNSDGTLASTSSNFQSSSGVVQGLVVNPSSSTGSPSLVLLQAPLPNVTAQSSTQPPVEAQQDLTMVSTNLSSEATMTSQPLVEQTVVPREPLEPTRGRSRSRSSHKDHRRRHRRSSSSFSSDSPRSPRRKKRKAPPDSQMLNQILGMLSSLPQFSQVQTSDRDQDQTPSTSGVNRDLPPETQVLSEDSDDSQADPLFQGHENNESVSGQQVFSEDYDSDEEELPLFGTDIPRDSFERAVEVLRRQLGYPLETPPEVPTSSKSRLTLNTPTTPSSCSLPVDAECADRFRALPAGSAGRKWTAYSKVQNSSFRVEDKDWRDLFKTPIVPQGADDYLRSVGALTPNGKLKSPAARKALRSLYQLDTASRVGLKFASSLLLIAEVITKSFRQSSSEVSRKDVSALVNLLGPLSRRVYDQFARVSVKSVADRRDIVLDAMHLSQENVKRHFRDLPILGQDIFAGQFESVLQEEAKRKKDLLKANLSSSRPFSNSRPFTRGRPSRPFRGRRNFAPSNSRPPPRSSQQPPRSRQVPFSQSQLRSRARAPTRGSYTSRGRGFSRP